MNTERSGNANKKQTTTICLEPSGVQGVEESIRHSRGDPGTTPGPRFTEEGGRRLAEFFILLDQMDRAHARSERKAA